MIRKNCQALGLLLGIACFTPVSYATSGFYMGIQGGMTNTNNVAMNIQTNTTPATVDTSPTNTGPGERIFIGGNFNDYFALELGLMHYAPSKYNPDPTALSNTPTMRENGGDLLGKLIWPFKESNFNIFALGGLAVVQQSQSGAMQPIGGTNASGTNIYVRPKAGLGAGYNITPSWMIDFSASIVYSPSTSSFKSAEFYALGLSYHFVDRYCGQFLCDD